MTEHLLHCPELKLRPVEPEDADFMWEVESDSTQWIQNSIVAPLSRESLLQYAISYDADPYRCGQLRLILTLADGTRVGVMDLYELSAKNHTAKVGIYVIPAYRNSNFGKRALYLLHNYAYQILNLRLLCAEILKDNVPSIRLFQSVGYEVAGSLTDWIQCGQKFYTLDLLLKTLP